MYRLLIVESEFIEREELADLVDWKSLGVELAGVAESAQDAIHLSQAAFFNIVLTDIRPLGLSGLELGRALLKANPRLKIIVNGGYGDIEHASQALEKRACSFIGKPIDHRELSAALRRIVKELDDEREQARSDDTLRALVRGNAELLRRHFFERLVSGSLSDAEIVKSLDYFGMDAVQGRFAVILIELDGFDRQSMSLDWEGLQMMLEAVRGAILSVRADGLLDCHYIDRGRFAVLLSLSRGDRKDEAGTVMHTAERIRGEASAAGGGSVTAGIGCAVGRVRDLRQSCKTAAAALAWKGTAGPGQVISYVDASAAGLETGQADVTATEDALAIAVQAGNAGDARNHIDRLFTSAKRKGWDGPRMNAACMRLLTRLLLLARETGVQEGDAFEGGALWGRMLECGSLPEMRAMALRCAAQVAERFAAKRLAAERDAVRQIMDYARRDLERMLSAEDLAREFGYTLNYVNIMFKRETGGTLADCLRGARLERACELLREPSMRIGEVAIRVGCPNVAHFCAQFKKKYGMNPIEYKERA